MIALALTLVPFVSETPPFVEVGEQCLPEVRTTSGSLHKDYILEVNGGGLVVEDFDGDGRLDLVVIDGSTIERVEEDQPGFPPRLFLQTEDGKFAEAPEAWAMSGGRWGSGGTAGDVNGDGFIDLVICEWGPDRLFLNQAGQGFREVPAEESGFKGRGWSTSAAFLDFDHDGKLDLVVTSYLRFELDEIRPRGEAEGCTWKGHAVMCGPEGLIPLHDRLYRGNGDGTFVDVSKSAGFRPREAGYGLGVTTLDYDADGDTDIYVTNDSTPNHLWENRGDGTFVEVANRRLVAVGSNGREQAGMGIACGDLDRDGRADLFVTNFSGENNSLYASSGKSRSFKEHSYKYGLAGPSIGRLGWGTGFGDFDLDGDLDLFVLNGHVYPQADEQGTDTTFAQPDEWFENTNDGFVVRRLSDAEPSVARAGLCVDLDGDGLLEIVAMDLDGPVRVLENTLTSSGHWLGVRLAGRSGNTRGIGARIVVRAGDARFTGEVRSSAGYQAGGPAAVHFGLGELSEIDAVEVHWPGGATQVVENVELDRWLLIEEAE